MDKPTIPFEKTSVGTSPWRVDGIGLVTGSAKFTDDIFLKGMLHAKILGSPHAHARILDIDTMEAEKLPGVVIVLTHKNVPRVAHTTAGQGYPEPSGALACLAASRISASGLGGAGISRPLGRNVPGPFLDGVTMGGVR